MAKGHRVTSASAVCKARAGFTLVEVMVAVMLLGGVMIALAGTAGYAARMLHRSKSLSLASMVGREKAEDIMALPYDSTDVGTTTKTVQLGYWNMILTTVVTQRETESLSDLKDVVVSVANMEGKELQRFQVAIQREWGR